MQANQRDFPLRGSGFLFSLPVRSSIDRFLAARLPLVPQLFLAVAFVFFSSTKTHATGGLRTVALSGAPAQGTSGVFSFSSSSPRSSQAFTLNNQGQVAFRATAGSPIVTEPPFPPFFITQGIWTEGGGTGLRLLAQRNAVAPGTAEDATFGFLFSNGEPLLNDQGQVAFDARLEGTAPSETPNLAGIWQEGSNGQLQLTIRAAEPAPGVDDVFMSFSDLSFNNNGQTVFYASFNPIEVAPNSFTSTDFGIWRGKPDGTLNNVAYLRGPTPGNEGLLMGPLGKPVLNNEGEIAFPASIGGPNVTSRDNSGIWRHTVADGLELFLREGDPAPLPGQMLEFGEFYNISPRRVTLNDQGEIAFNAELRDLFPGREVKSSLWTDAGGGGLRLVAQEGDDAPGVPPEVVFDAPGLRAVTPLLNNQGIVAFATCLDGPGVVLQNEVGIFRESLAGGLKLVARAGDPAPGTDAGVVYGQLSQSDVSEKMVLNSHGQIAFLAQLAGPDVNSTNREGIWAEDISGVQRLLVRSGQTLDVSDDPATSDLRVITDLEFIGGSGNADSRQSTFNDRGELAFFARFLDGSSGIFVSSAVAVPEPSGASMIAFFVLAGTVATRRHRTGGAFQKIQIETALTSGSTDAWLAPHQTDQFGRELRSHRRS